MNRKTIGRLQRDHAARDMAEGYGSDDAPCLCGHPRWQHDAPDFGVRNECEEKGCGCLKFEYAYTLGHKTKYGLRDLNLIYKGPSVSSAQQVGTGTVLQTFGIPMNCWEKDIQEVQHLEALAFARQVVADLNAAALERHKQKHWVVKASEHPSRNADTHPESYRFDIPRRVSEQIEKDRLQKAQALFKVCREFQVNADNMKAMGDPEWKLAAEAANVNPPSPITQALVIQMMEASEAAGAAVKIKRKTNDRSKSKK